MSKEQTPKCMESYKLGLLQGYLDGVVDGREDPLPEIPEDEKAYRRGFAHGFHVSKKDATSAEIIAKWRYSKKILGAPGTIFEGKPFP